MSSGITVAYSGVHQAYQIALAAAELQQLDGFYCSLFAAPGKCGGWLEKFFGAEAMRNRRLADLPAQKIAEIPWPLLCHRARSWIFPSWTNDWTWANDRFDRKVASNLETSPSTIFVGVETCAAASLAAARARGMTTVLDCPGIDAAFLDRLANQAATELGLQTSAEADTPAMCKKKSRELALADRVLVCSDFQAQRLRESACAGKTIHVLPLWADTDFWHPANRIRLSAKGPLRVLYAGKITLRKGVPYLIRAAAQSGSNVRLTLVGNVDRELAPYLKSHEHLFSRAGPCTKAELRRQYHLHDVFVLPSLGDAFGFVAMEAMACGLPVIVTDNCGVPVPDPAWRVRVMNADALAARLQIYAQDRELCRADGQVAAAFAQRFTAQHYRDRIKEFFCSLLAAPEDTSAALGAMLDPPDATVPREANAR